MQDAEICISISSLAQILQKIKKSSVYNKKHYIHKGLK